MFEGLQDKPGHRWLNELKETFPQAEAYLVGGVVRDAMLGQPSKDEDFVVRGVPGAELEAFLKERGEVNLVGRGFGVFKFRPKRSQTTYDIALPRTETPAGTGGYRDVETQSDHMLPIDKDLARRDFTANAIAWDIFGGKLIDPFGGVEDLNARRLKAVGSADARFAEDLTRVLRALRLSVTLGLSIEHETAHAISEAMPRLNGRREDGSLLVPLEIASRELLKSIEADPARALAVWHETGALRVLVPELEAVSDEARHAVERLPSGVSLEASVAALFLPYADGRVAQAALERLRVATALGLDIEPARVGRVVNAATFLKTHDPDKTPLVEVEDVVAGIAPEALAVAWAGGVSTTSIADWRTQVEKLDAPPLLTGSEVQEALGLTENSPKVGAALRALRQAQLEGKVGSAEEAKIWVQKT